MKAFYDNKPSVLEAVGNGSHLYRYDIEEVTVEATESNGSDEQPEAEARTQWQCQEVTVWPPLSANKITEAVLTDKWENNYEQKLVNEYNAAMLDLYDEEETQARIRAYKDFLTERARLKAQVDADCAELGVN